MAWQQEEPESSHLDPQVGGKERKLTGNGNALHTDLC